MAKRINLIGRKFGKLTVVSFDGKRSQKGHPIWLCVCDCGKEIEVQGQYLLCGDTKSCGCLRNGPRRRKHEEGKAAKKMAYNKKKGDALRRYIKFNLSFEEFIKITSKNCYYCNSEHTNICRNSKHNGDYIHNGLDRLDSNKDYTLDNVVPCCKHCNLAKRTMSEEDFLNWIKKVYLWQMELQNSA